MNLSPLNTLKHFITIRHYLLHTNEYTAALIILPDFETFSINSVGAVGEVDLLYGRMLTTSISFSQFAHYVTTATLPQGADLSHLVASLSP